VILYRVEFSPEALDQAERIGSWWAANRRAAPDLFRDELGAGVAALEVAPRIGSPYPPGAVTGLRRLLLPRSQHHVYYTVEEQAVCVRVHAVWHTSRAHGPLL
jgi:plasmid stabilization system protein ParE